MLAYKVKINQFNKFSERVITQITLIFKSFPFIFYVSSEATPDRVDMTYQVKGSDYYKMEELGLFLWLNDLQKLHSFSKVGIHLYSYPHFYQHDLTTQERSLLWGQEKSHFQTYFSGEATCTAIIPLSEVSYHTHTVAQLIQYIFTVVL